jgi:hypothetical protein
VNFPENSIFASKRLSSVGKILFEKQNGGGTASTIPSPLLFPPRSYFKRHLLPPLPWG